MLPIPADDAALATDVTADDAIEVATAGTADMPEAIEDTIEAGTDVGTEYEMKKWLKAYRVPTMNCVICVLVISFLMERGTGTDKDFRA